MLTTVKKITGHYLRVGDQEHSGWLPESAVDPLPTPQRDFIINLEIQYDGSGYLLCYESEGGELSGDTWHETLAEAEGAAVEMFDVSRDQWKAIEPVV